MLCLPKRLIVRRNVFGQSQAFFFCCFVAAPDFVTLVAASWFYVLCTLRAVVRETLHALMEHFALLLVTWDFLCVSDVRPRTYPLPVLTSFSLVSDPAPSFLCLVLFRPLVPSMFKSARGLNEVGYGD